MIISGNKIDLTTLLNVDVTDKGLGTADGQKPLTVDASTYNIVNCTTIQCNTVNCTTINCTTIQCNTVNCTTINCTTIDCTTVQCHTNCSNCRYSDDCRDDAN